MSNRIQKLFSSFLILALALALMPFASASAASADDLIITGIIDGPLTGGIPKAVELYAVNAIPDLSIYGLGSENSAAGGGTQEFTFPPDSVPAGSCIYVATEAVGFSAFFGFNPSYTDGVASINGDDSIELFTNSIVTDTFGDVNTDGTGQAWEYLDGWAYRQSSTGPDGNTFVLGNWYFSGPNALDGETSNATAAVPFPIGTYGPCVLPDGAPAIASTTPADGSTGVALDADISLSFSEDVAVSGPWFDLTCSASGTHTASVSGGPQDYSLNPDLDFDYGDSCTLTVYALQVSDLDSNDPPDNMDGDFTITFQTENPPGVGSWIINEIHADPDSTAGDANGDGTSQFSDDEFVELFNDTGSAADISGWTLADGFGIRHTFQDGTVVPNQCAVVVFGGGTLTGSFRGAIAQTASTGALGLNNGGDSVTLNDGAVDQAVFSYGSEGGDNQSLTLDPDITGSTFVKHSVAAGSGGALFSPGTYIDGSRFSGCPRGLLINEVDSDTPGSDSLEFVELYDGGDGNTSLDGTVLVFFNGNGDVSYNAFDLDGFSTNADGYFMLGNNTVSPTPDITFSNNGLQNGADAVALYEGDGSDFLNGTGVTTDNLIDAMVYDTNDSDDAGLLVLLNPGQPQVNEDGADNKDNHSNQRCPDGSGSARNTNTYFQLPPTPGMANICLFDLEIFEIQGNGASSPYVGQSVHTSGVVVADFQGSSELNGFFLQTQDAFSDNDPATSDGIFVFNPGGLDVAVGDEVEVTGQVSEVFGMTEINNVAEVLINTNDNSLPTVTSLSLPVTSVEAFEAYEGMYVTFPQALVISEYFNFDRFGEIVLTSERHLTPTAEFEPGSPEAAQAAQDYLLDKITLDDGRTSQNPDPAIHPNGSDFSLTNLFRGGDTVANVTGVINYDFGLYRVQPTQGADYTEVNSRPVTPDDVGGNLKVASFNVLNYFNTIDNGTDDICGADQIQECRGADNEAERIRQLDKIVSAMSAMEADILGIIEVENTPGVEAMSDIVDGLNANLGAGTYNYIDTGVIGMDAIKVGFIYKAVSVAPVGDYAVLDSSVDSRFNDEKNRPALAQTFVNNTTGGVFTVAVNHLKSKGSACDDIGDPDTGDGAGNCNLTRKAAAEALVDWLTSDPTGSADEDFLIIGDLNSYDKEEPIDAILNGGYTDLVFQNLGEDAYSYVFDGQLGYLDHALANADLLVETKGVTIWHINADEPDLIDYDTSFKRDAQDAIYYPNAFRSSDHDPVIVGLEMTTEAEVHELIDDVHGLFDGGMLNGGQSNALISKLRNVLEKLAKGNTNAAANQLGAFINQLEDFVDEGILTSGQAEPLMKSASLLVEVLGK